MASLIVLVSISNASKGVMMPSAKRWAKIEQCLKEQQVDYDYVQSENTGSVERLVKMYINNGYKTIVIIGGDSALNDAVNRDAPYL